MTALGLKKIRIEKLPLNLTLKDCNIVLQDWKWKLPKYAKCAILAVFIIFFFSPIPHGLFSYLIHMAMAYDKPSLRFQNSKMHTDNKNFFSIFHESFLGVVVSIPICKAEDWRFDPHHGNGNFLGKFLIPFNFKILF